jgi:ribosomal protein S24E
MEVKVVREEHNPLFSRKEVGLEVTTEITPSKEEAKKLVAEKFSADESLVRIRVVEGKFGSQTFTIVADVYDSIEEFDRIVKKTKQEIDAEKKAEEERLKAEEEAKLVAEEAKKAETEVVDPTEAGEEAQSE